MLKPSLQLRLGQQLTMTPQLQQAIRLLQLPALDLQQQIREALEQNVMLEAEEESEIALEAADAEAPEPGTDGVAAEVGVEASESAEGEDVREEPRDEPTVEIGEDHW